MMIHPAGEVGKKTRIWVVTMLAVALISAIGGIVANLVGQGGVQPTPSSPTQAAVPSPTLSQSTTPAVPTPEPTTYTPPPPPVVTPVTILVVPGNQSDGLEFVVPQTGTYRFTYVTGAYTVHGNDPVPPGVDPYLTAIYVFRGDRAPFNGDFLAKEQALFALVDTGYSPTEGAAIQKATGLSSEEYSLNQGEIITLVGVDSHFYYGENTGSVSIQVDLVTRA